MVTFLLLAVVVLAGTAADVTLTRVMKRVSHKEEWHWRVAPRRIARALGRWQWFMAIGLMALAFFSLITVLSWANVSFVVPATAANLVVGSLAAKFMLKEHLDKTRLVGVLLVTAGVVLVFASNYR